MKLKKAHFSELAELLFKVGYTGGRTNKKDRGQRKRVNMLIHDGFSDFKIGLQAKSKCLYIWQSGVREK